MTELTPIITQSVQSWVAKLLNHFKEQYGSIIFLPLGVNSSTSGKIAPGIAQSIEEVLLKVEENKVSINVKEEKVWIVFDTFIDNFFNSLNFIAKTAMKALGMKLTWTILNKELADRKANNPSWYETWKNNITLVLQKIFDEVIANLQANGKEVFIFDGEKYFASSSEAIAAMKIFN